MLEDPNYDLKLAVLDVRAAMREYDYIMTDCTYHPLISDINKGGHGIRLLQKRGYEMYSVLFYMLWDFDHFDRSLFTNRGCKHFYELVNTAFCEPQSTYLKTLFDSYLLDDPQWPLLPDVAVDEIYALKKRHSSGVK